MRRGEKKMGRKVRGMSWGVKRVIRTPKNT